MKTIIITGVTGQDGSLMADHLLEDPKNKACCPWEPEFLLDWWCQDD
jgi:hypothetical protein